MPRRGGSRAYNSVGFSWAGPDVEQKRCGLLTDYRRLVRDGSVDLYSDPSFPTTSTKFSVWGLACTVVVKTKAFFDKYRARNLIVFRKSSEI